jgi:hypothetical protein
MNDRSCCSSHNPGAEACPLRDLNKTFLGFTGQVSNVLRRSHVLIVPLRAKSPLSAFHPVVIVT